MRKRRESKIGELQPRISRRMSFLSSSNFKKGGFSLISKSLFAGEAEESEDELNETYDFKKLATAKTPETLLKSMSFNVDTSRLYLIEKTCVLSQANLYCPILLRITDNELIKSYGGEFVV